MRDTCPFAAISHRLAFDNLRAVAASASHPSSTVQHGRCASRRLNVASLVPTSHDAASLILAPRDVASHITALHDVASRIPASRDATLHIPVLHDIAVTILEFFRHILPQLHSVAVERARSVKTEQIFAHIVPKAGFQGAFHPFSSHLQASTVIYKDKFPISLPKPSLPRPYACLGRQQSAMRAEIRSKLLRFGRPAVGGGPIANRGTQP